MIETFQSISPIDESIIWTGLEASDTTIDQAVNSARTAFKTWSRLSFEERVAIIAPFIEKVKEHKNELAQLLTQETGKMINEAELEIASIINKFKISQKAYEERTSTKITELKTGVLLQVKHKAHGVLAVFGPYNFPLHVTHGHILPALLAGNTIVLKPSEMTPAISEKIIQFWLDSGLPHGVINLIQGKANTGIKLSKHAGLDGLLFTGSSKVGVKLSEQFASSTGKILALEMGGNNPLIVDSEISNLEQAVNIVIQSAFLTSGQRCTCARRLILVDGPHSKDFLDLLITNIQAIKIGNPYDTNNFMGPLISQQKATEIINAQRLYLEHSATSLVSMRALDLGPSYVSPALLAVDQAEDIEYFGPLLKLYRAKNLEEAINIANNTAYGLSACLISDKQENFDFFYQEVRAGIINWNEQSTGASSDAPFGGIGLSGNHRPSAYYAADYCAYPVSSQLRMPS